MALNPKNKPRAERRRGERISVPLKLKYKVTGNDKFFDDFVCEDISGFGMKVSIKQLLSVNDKIEVFIIQEALSKPLIKASCRVCWIRKSGKDKFCAGLEFLKIKDRMHFIEFFCEKMLSLSSALK